PTGNNFFRVQGKDVGGPGVNQIQTNLFAVSGRLADTNAPVITLFGSNPVNVNQNASYIDAGASALDDLGGNLTGNIEVSGLPVDTSTIGVKTVTYTVTDSAGRTSQATRTVNVVNLVAVGEADTVAPLITILGANPAFVTVGTPYTDVGATALDNVDGDITGSIITTGLPVITSTVGTFTVTYNVADSAGNAAILAKRTVNVVADTTAPVITMLGSNPVNIFTGAAYSDAGATALDDVDGDITGSIVTTGLPVDTSKAATFTITYEVVDSAGNPAIAKRTVKVAETLPASLSEAGPIAPEGGLMAGFPSWYKDSNGLALDLMEAADGFGISDPVDPQTIGFNAEGFWWSAEASIDRPVGTRTILVLAVEAAFAGEAAVDGEQSVQNRLRYRIDGLVPGETYTITHPFGTVKEVAEDDGTINVTDDIGCFAGGGVTCNQTASPNFATALNGQVGPFLTWTTFNTNPALTDPQLTNPANPNRRYVGNPTIEHEVTGSPTGNNFFRVQGKDVGGPGVNQIQTNLFAVSGRLADTNAPVITLNGSNPVEVTQNEAYADSGATAIDNFDGNLTASIVTTGLPVNTSVIGVKTITYTVSDRAGNTAIAQRTINVVAATPPTPEPPVPPVPADGAGQADTTSLDGFSSTTKGSYKTGDLIDITANFDKTLDAESTMTVELSNGVQVILSQVSGSKLTGTYIVGTNISENSDNLTVAKIISSSIQASDTLPSINLSSIVVNVKTSAEAADKSGQADVNSLLELDSETVLDMGSNLSTATIEGAITIAGLSKLLSIFSNGDLVNQNLTLPQIIGDKLVMVSKAVRLNSGPSGSLITLSNKNLSTVKLSIVSGTTVLGESSWNGKVNPPSIVTNTGIAPSGFKLGDFAIEVGYPEGILLFDQSVTILLSGVNGPVGYKPSGSDTWVKMANCLGTFDSPLKPVFPGECAISNGADTKIYTYHLTSFANLQEIPPVSIPTPTPAIVVASSSNTDTNTNTTSSNSNLSNSSSNNTSNNPSTPVCTDSKPGSAPILLSAVTSGPNQVTLTWSKASDPVSHYSIVYGLSAGNPIYGNTNVGGKDTTSYAVGGLSGGTTYYFKVRAGNGCNGSEYSNELSAAPDGGTINSPATGFTRGLLGAQTEEETKTSEPGVLGVNVNGLASKSKGTWAIQLMLAALAALGVGYFKFFYRKKLNG
ncbi:MAG: DUF5011 domain-containing protein, partial [Candidatus Blackburnbacteria bacterium]|nr:DUF5011 domain-containing protein [Candidatus Blackburnbacteria bacterium]